ADLNVEGLLKGMYLFKKSEASGGSAPPTGHSAGSAPRAQILVSGVTMPEGLRAQELLADEWGVAADVWSVTSW
ncbi:hypothetical protein QNA29_42315, partial [Rhodococcus opacus]|nr:hypothetical protein [Rhodococcus opacus]